MSVKLTAEEEELRSQIEERMEKARQALAEDGVDDDVATWILEAGERAHKLHMLLKARGHEPKHHAYMVKNRELPSDDTEFYMHFHPIEDLLKFLQDEHANDDPVDQTINADFAFSVYSRRWGHNDSYGIKRTKDGWIVSHMAIGGPCDKGGRPFLFDNLDHDSIQYPDGLDGYIEWLWERAASRGLNHTEVQAALQQLADWVSTTEKNSPSIGLWEGY